MYNRIQYKLYLMSPSANAVLRTYIDSVKDRVRCRKVLLRKML